MRVPIPLPVPGSLPCAARPAGRCLSPLGHELRARQELSAGRGAAGVLAAQHHGLHPMQPSVWALTLAMMLPVLAPRLEAMRRQRGEGAAFDLDQFRDADPFPAPAFEREVAAWVAWAAGSPLSPPELGRILAGVPDWPARERWVFSQWIANPLIFCYETD